MAYARDFTYDNRTLLSIDPNLIVVSFDSTSTTSENEIVSRNVLRSDITYDDVLTYDYGAVDNSVYKLKLTIARMDGDVLSQSLVRTLVSWLISPTEPKWLTFNRGGCASAAMYDGVEFKGRFNRVTYDMSTGYNKYAISFEFENISPFGFTRQYAWEFDLQNSSSSATLSPVGTNVGKLVTPAILITSDSSTGGAELPDDIDNLEFTRGEGQIISIHNLDGNTAPFLIQCPQDVTIAVIGDNCYYYNDDPAFDVRNMSLYNFSNLVNFNFPRMVSGGVNRFVFEGTGNIIIVSRMYEALGV